MADDLLFVYSSPGTVDPAEFTDWYDNEHVPARLGVPGFGAVARFRPADGLAPEWLATYEIEPGTLGTAAYKALSETASEREKSIMPALAALERRVYSPISDSGAVPGAAASVLMAVSMPVPECRRRAGPAGHTPRSRPRVPAAGTDGPRQHR